MNHDPTKETQVEFEMRYKEKFPRVVFGEKMVSMSCTCEDGGGPTHWAAVRNSSRSIQEHLDFEEILSSNRD